MNPHLARLQPYPFEKLRRLLAEPDTSLAMTTTGRSSREINLSIGEPRHATPSFIRDTLAANFDGLSVYPSTQGSDTLRQAIASWISRRYKLPVPDAMTQVLPVNGSREALFAFAQTVIDGTSPHAQVLCPNPFYQIYEGAALLAGATPQFLNTVPDNDFTMAFSSLTEPEWRHVQLVYVCSPGNPTGKVMDMDAWQRLFDLSDQHGFIIASDECYSEIYPDETAPPLGGLEAASRLGRDDYRNLVMFSSLSKRSNVPGLRSGFVAGDARLIRQFLRYRTYHGSAMSLSVQAASLAAWNDEAHVIENRRLYREKFERVTPLLAQCLNVGTPDAGFYLWASVAHLIPAKPGADSSCFDTTFTRSLQHQYNVSVLPGSFLARETNGVNPGANFIRIALVADLDDCIEAAQRIVAYCQTI